MLNVYKQKAEEGGHRIRIYTQLPTKFEKIIGSPDGMVVFTAMSSHKMVNAALKYAKKKSIPFVRCHNNSSTSLEFSIKQLEECLAAKAG